VKNVYLLNVVIKQEISIKTQKTKQTTSCRVTWNRALFICLHALDSIYCASRKTPLAVGSHDLLNCYHAHYSQQSAALRTPCCLQTAVPRVFHSLQTLFWPSNNVKPIVGRSLRACELYSRTSATTSQCGRCEMSASVR